MLCQCNVESAIHYKRGVRNFLEFQDALNEYELNRQSRLLASADVNLEALMANIFQATKFSVACELQVKEHQRLVAAGSRTPGADYAGLAMELNQLAISAGQKAQIALQEVTEKFRDEDSELSHLKDAHLQAGARQALAEAKQLYLADIIDFPFNYEEFVEIEGIWNEVSEIASNNGVEGLLQHLETNLQQFVELRRQPTRGTQHHSPLPWWKYVIIGVVIAVSIFAVIGCFVWAKCKWVWNAISSGGWLFTLVENCK